MKIILPLGFLSAIAGSAVIFLAAKGSRPEVQTQELPVPPVSATSNREKPADWDGSAGASIAQPFLSPRSSAPASVQSAARPGLPPLPASRGASLSANSTVASPISYKQRVASEMAASSSQADQPAAPPATPVSSVFRAESPNFHQTVSTGQTDNATPPVSQPIVTGASGAASSSQPTASHQDVQVPDGSNVPAVLAQPGGSTVLDPTSQQEVSALADSFLTSVDQQTAAGTPREAAWQKQTAAADDAFRARYGWEAYVTENARANRESDSSAAP